jgi:APA family basic amino acid/polyamine antiporter
LRPLIETAGSFMLAWYFITHYSALQLPKAKRLTSPFFSWYGIVGCIGLVIAMPHAAVLAAGGALAGVTAGRFVVGHTLTPRRLR